MPAVIHVRTEGEAGASAKTPADLVAESGPRGIRAETEVAADAEGPFEKAAVAVEKNGALRDRLAAAIPTPSLARWSRLRFFVLGAAAIPMLMLLELDRELASSNAATFGRLVVDAILTVYVGWELTRRTPRMPGVAAAAVAAVAIRWALFATRLCGKGVHVAVWAAMLLAATAAAAIASRSPSRGRVALELFAKLGVSRADVLAARLAAPASGTFVAAAAAAAIGLPVLLAALRRQGIGLEVQGIVFVAYALVLPTAVRRAFDSSARTEARAAPMIAARTALAIAAGFALTAALMDGAHHFFDAGAELARCTGRLDEETKRVLAREADEIARGVAGVRASTTAIVMAVALGPLVEERIYRDLLMRALVRKYGAAYGLFASALVFGVAHVGVYQLALYQTVLLGVAFGVAYAEGGILAAFTVHATWNLLRLC